MKHAHFNKRFFNLLVFAVFSVLYLGERLNWRHLGAFACLVGAVAFMFAGKLKA